MSNSTLYGWYTCGKCGHKSREAAPLPFPHPCGNCAATEGSLYLCGEAPPSHQEWWAGELQKKLDQANSEISALSADAVRYITERDQLQLDLNEKDRLIDLLRPRDTVRSTTANGDQVTIHASGKIELDQIKPMVEADRDIKMPDRKILGCFSDGAAVIAVAVWNACLDEVCRLNNSSMKAPLDSGVRHVGFKSPPTQHTATFDKEKVTVVIENDLITSKSERIY